MVATLQSRKEALEAKILEKNEELKRLCLQEADLTGVIPPEIPLEPGEPPPPVRRRVGTSFSFPQNLLNNIKDADEESLIALEVECKVQTNIAEAALTLANDTTVNKAARRKHRLMYRQSQRRLSELEARLNLLRQGKSDQTKPQQIKKKPRPNTTAVENLGYIWNKAQGQVDNQHFNGSNTAPWSSKRMVDYSADDIDGGRDYFHSDIFGSLQRSYKSSGTSLGSNSPKIDLEGDDGRSQMFNGSHKSDQFLLDSSYLNMQDVIAGKSNMKGNANLSHLKRSPKRGVVRRQWDTQSAGGTLLPNQTYPDHSHQPNLSRTQSLGSVEANSQRSGKVAWSAHDFPLEGSACKEKEWYETALDSAPSPPLRTSSRLPSTARMLYQMQEMQCREWNGMGMPSLQASNSHPALPTTPNVAHRNIVRSASAYQAQDAAVTDDMVSSMQQMNLNANPKGRMDNLYMSEIASIIHGDFNYGYGQADARSLYEYPKQGETPLHMQTEMKQKNDHPPVDPVEQARYIDKENMGLIRQNSLTAHKYKTGKHDESETLTKKQELGLENNYRLNDSVYINIPDENEEGGGMGMKTWIKDEDYAKGEAKLEYPPKAKVPTQPYYHLTKSSHQPEKIENLQYQAARNRQNVVEDQPQLPVHHPPHAITQNEITFDTVVPFESPQNHTVVQAGKWQPYREVTKPFEMSDFYKYSTKFRQNNGGGIGAGGGSGSAKAFPPGNPPDMSRNSPNTQHQKGVYTPLRPMTCQPIDSKSSQLIMGHYDDDMDQNQLVEVSLPEIV